MPKERAKLRKERRKEQQDNYLVGRASRPYVHTPTLNRSFDDDQPGTSAAPSSGEKTICSKCHPVLSRWKDTFKGLVQQGSELKRRKCRNPDPKCSDLQPYRDLNRQNSWLRNNVFDAMGNYLFCACCICAAFHISPQRISKQRAIKRKHFSSPAKVMT